MGLQQRLLLILALLAAARLARAPIPEQALPAMVAALRASP